MSLLQITTTAGISSIAPNAVATPESINAVCNHVISYLWSCKAFTNLLKSLHLRNLSEYVLVIMYNSSNT